MATTPQPLVWDFYRATDGAQGLGSVIHYLDESSQSLYLNGGIATTVASVPEGHWETAEQSAAHQITNDAFTDLRWDHPSNGTLYGVATDGNSITFLRYIYGMDISNITDAWSWLSQNDTSVAQFDAEVENIDPEIFGDDASLFQPGARLKLNIFMGDSSPYRIGIAWMDETNYDQTAETVKLTGRNTIGYFLKDQTFDDQTKFSGTTTAVLTAILEYAGLSNFIVQELTTEKAFEFKPTDTLLGGIEEVLEYYTTLNEKMEIVELPDGTIVIGFEDWIAEYHPRGYYSFDEGREVFKRNTTRAADGTYTALRVTGRDSDNNDLAPVTVSIANFPHWSLGRHRTKHLTAPDGLTQSGLQEWAEAQARILQYVGIGEDFSAPFRPHLLVGDVAEVVRDNTGTSLGIVTEVKQAFDRQNGFRTDFSVDSGGVVSKGRSVTVYSRTASVHGYNRRQGIVDLIRYTAEKAGSVDNVTASDVGAEKKGTTSTLLSEHNENQFAHPYIQQQIELKLSVPAIASVGQYLRVLSVDENGKVTGVEAVSANTGSDGGIVDGVNAETLGGKTLDEIINAAASAAVRPAVVNYAYEHTTDSTSHARSYAGTPGHMLLLAILHRGELTASPSGWTLLGTLTESGDYNAGSTTTLQYVSVFYKKCTGSEVIAYEQAMSNTSITCLIEFEGVSGFEILASSIQENVSTSTTPEFTCSRTSTRLAVWFTNAIYFTNNTYKWNVSDSTVWAISDNQGVSPRLGVYVDNRPAPNTFTIDSGLSNRYASAFCVQIIP